MHNNTDRPALMYDGTLLANTYSRSNSDRTGVYFTVYNVFIQLMKQEEFAVSVYAEAARFGTVRQALDDLGYQEIKLCSDMDIERGDVPDAFLSSFAPPPPCIANRPDVARYMILYDVMPLALPEIEAPNQEWYDLLRRSLNNQDHYIAISEYTRKDFLRFYPVLDPEKITVSYLGASPAFYACTDKKKISRVKQKYGIPTTKPYVFSLCTLQPRKNLVHAVKCFIRFVEENNINDLYFVLGGGHWDEFLGILDTEIDGLGKWKDRIIKTGYIEDEDLGPLYADAMFTVYVSLYEGFGLPVLEAMQCGCPVITSSTTSLPEVIGDAGLTVDPQDPVALRAAYKRYYFDTAFRKACGKAGLRRARQFSWAGFTQDILSQIRQTREKTVVEQMSTPPTKPESLSRKPSVKCFGKEWSPECTTYRIAFLPFLREIRSERGETIKFLGIPIICREYLLYEVRTRFLGIPVKTRPNYRYIESQIALYTGSLAKAFSELGKRLEANREVLRMEEAAPTKSVEQEMESLAFYQLLTAVGNGKITLRQELRAVDRLLRDMEETHE